MEIVRKPGILYLLSVPVLLLLADPFIPSPLLRWVTCLLLALPVSWSLGRNAAGRIALRARMELKSLLEYLCTAVASGRVLPIAFQDAGRELSLLYGHRSATVKALKRFEEQIRLGNAFSETLLELASDLRCPEAVPLFDAFTKADLLGNRILPILRHSLTMVSEQIAVWRDITSDISQKRTEAVVMSGMPFLVVWSISSGAHDYIASAFSRPIGSLLFLMAFVLSVLSFCASILLLSGPVHRERQASVRLSPLSLNAGISLLFRLLSTRFGRLSILLQRIAAMLPPDLILTRRRMLLSLQTDRNDPIPEYVFTKITIVLIGCFFCLLLLPIFGFQPIVWLMFPLLLLVAHDVDLHLRITSGQTRILRDFPGFLGLLTTLLRNGMVLSKAIPVCIDTMQGSSVEFRRELGLLKGFIYAGIPVGEALEQIAGRTGSTAISGALLLAAQYGRSGSPETLNMLGLQMGVCWAQMRSAARKQLDEASVKMLLPMMVQLICVMIASVLPSVVSVGLI
jgi:Flp pilus assembly protein TadB